MTEMKHTKEPWKYNDKTGCIEGLTREPDKHWTGKCHVIGHLFHDADSARAAVCVSALSGIPNPPAFVEAARKLLEAGKAARDSLLDGIVIMERIKAGHSATIQLSDAPNGVVATAQSAESTLEAALKDLENHLPAEGDKRN